MTGRDFQWFWSELAIPSDMAASEALCRLILAEAACGRSTPPTPERIIEAMERSGVAADSRAAAGFAGLVPRNGLPAIIATPPTATAVAAWFREVVPLITELLAAVPALPAAVAAEPAAVENLLRVGLPPHTVAVLREGIVPVASLGEPEVVGRVRAAGAAAVPIAAVRRLVADGTSAELAGAFADAVRRAGRKESPEDEDAARSAAERFLFGRLETLPATAGLFALNQRLDFRHGPADAEVDLLAAPLRLVVELDGSHYHLADAAAYRRDRRKDWELQRRGYLVLRFLSEDVVERLEEILDTILTAVECRRVSQPERGRDP
jgi:hypothetical protein